MSDIKNDYQEMKSKIVSAIQEFEAKHPTTLFDKINVTEINTLNPNIQPKRVFDIKLTYNPKYLERP